MRKRIAGLLVVLATVAGLVAVATPAHAALADCTGATKVCLWSGVNFSGAPNWTSTMPVGIGGCVNVGVPGNNSADSVLNETPYRLSFYDSYSGVGFLFSLNSGSGISNLDVFPAPGNYDNRVSSICRA